MAGVAHWPRKQIPQRAPSSTQLASDAVLEAKAQLLTVSAIVAVRRDHMHTHNRLGGPRDHRNFDAVGSSSKMMPLASAKAWIA